MTIAELAQLRSQTLPKQSKRSRREDGGFATLGEQLLAIRAAAISSTTAIERVDPRLTQLQQRAFAAGASEAVPGDGGFLVAPQFARKILRRMYSTGEIFRRCTQFPITNPNANALKFPQFDESSRAEGSRLGGIQVVWENEADTLTASKPKLMASELIARKIIGLLYCSNELLADSDAMDSWARYAFSLELLFKLENAIVNGTGAGQPQGILTSPATVIVAKEAGQAYGTVIASNVEKMLAAFWAASYNSDGACWLFNQSLLPQLASLSTVVGTGGSESKLWQWATADDDYDRLAGFPAIITEYCGVSGSVGDIVLCDFSRYILAIRETMRAEISLHVRWLTDESAFRFIMRVNGQPIDRSPVTPLNSSTATSPFVCLAAR